MYSKPTAAQVNDLFESLTAISRHLQNCTQFLSHHIVNGEILSLAKDMHRLSGKVEKARIDFITALKGGDNA